MIIEEFKIDDLDLKYYVAILQISIDLNVLMHKWAIRSEKEFLNKVFELIDKLQSENDVIIQFINDEYLLNYEHVYNASYYLIKAFHLGDNISKKKNIELLLYLSASRQIKIGIETFGLNTDNLITGILSCCIITFKDNLEVIKDAIIEYLSGDVITSSDLNDISFVKFKKIKDFFNITQEQINVILNSYGDNLNDVPIGTRHSVLNELICEKMSLLSLEKLKVN